MPTECYNLPRSIVYPEVKIVLGSSGLGGARGVVHSQ